MPSGVHKKHLLWELYFLRVYDIKENCSQNIGEVEEKTFREWSFRFVDAISYLESSLEGILVVRPFPCAPIRLLNSLSPIKYDGVTVFKEILATRLL